MNALLHKYIGVRKKFNYESKMKLLLIFFLAVFLKNQKCSAFNMYNESYYRPLIADNRAYFPGDLLTVIVMETSNAQTGADLSSGKEIKTALEANYNKNQYRAGIALSGKGKSNAKTGRNGKIKAALTVQIKAILPNDNYQIEGRQIIQINGEQQIILLRGVVRQEDITPQNTILSTRIANAEISYTGHGDVSNSQRHNYIYQILSYMGLV